MYKIANTNDASQPVTTTPLEATHADFFGDETELDMSNITNTYLVPTTLNTRIHKDHSLDYVIRDVQSSVQTRRMTRTTIEQGFSSAVYEEKTHEDLQNCLFACFLSQVEPKKVIQALTDPSWIEAMQDELLQFKLQKVWTLVDLPYGKRAIGTKWVYRNKKDERGIVIRNKARLVAQGYTQEEGIYYDEVFALVARIEAIRLTICLEAYTDSDYAGASLDRKSITGAEYVAASSCCGQTGQNLGVEMCQQTTQLEHFGLRCQEDTDDTGLYCHQFQSQHRSLNVLPGASPDSTDIHIIKDLIV
ncbi:putative ribonuclease H-like domain-containing protein [Tanacetum coccineum]